MRIGIPTETAPRELRVAVTPDSVARLVKAGFQPAVQQGAGSRAGFSDDAYTKAGATIAPDYASTVAGAAIVAKIQPPSEDEISRLDAATVVLSLMQPGRNDGLPARLAARKITGLALELVPRITRAQSMDVLSSQSTVAGYKAVLIGASELDKFLPMLTTAAGNVPPAKVFVIGAGVAGLQAIATARRLGGQVSAFDVRPAAREQVLSLGATFVAAELAAAGAEAAGGYARAQTDEERARTTDALATHISGMDLVITTAQVPGREAPRLVTRAMIHSMRPGAVIVDLAAETGGNTEVTRAGETVVERGVRVLGPVNLPATLPHHASQMFGRNVLALITELVKDGKVDLSGEIAQAMVVRS